MALINQTDTQGLQFWMQSWLKPVTRKTTEARDQSLVEKSQSVSVPNMSRGIQSTPADKTLSWWLQSTSATPVPVKTWPWYDNVNDSIDNKMQDLDRKLTNTRWAVFSIWPKLWGIPWINQPTIAPSLQTKWFTEWLTKELAWKTREEKVDYNQAKYWFETQNMNPTEKLDYVKKQQEPANLQKWALFDLAGGKTVEEVIAAYPELAWKEEALAWAVFDLPKIEDI